MVKKKNRGKRKKFTHISKSNQQLIDQYVRFWTIKKTLSDKAQHNVRTALEKLADYLGKKSFRDVTKENLITYFGDPKIFNPINRSRDSNAVLVIPFYRWLEGIEDKTRPSVLRWYEHQSAKQRRRHEDPYKKEKHLITAEDYEKIMHASNDAYGQNKALWETMYLSGARPNEIAQLKIKHVSQDNGNYTVTIDQDTSKTWPRPIHLPEQPYNLARWLGNHPMRDDKEAPLWISLKNSEDIDTSTEEFITRRFSALKQHSSVKKTLTPKDFRKTRATILFGDRTYNDGDIGKIMGWTPQTVALRRQEYDLSDYEDLKKKVFSRPSIPISYEAIEKEKRTLEDKYLTQINTLENRIGDLEIVNKEYKVPIEFLENSAHLLMIMTEYYLYDIHKRKKDSPLYKHEKDLLEMYDMLVDEGRRSLGKKAFDKKFGIKSESKIKKKG
jgi:integrase